MNDPGRFERLWKGAERSVARLIARFAPVEERDDLLLETRLAVWRSFDRFEGDERSFGSYASRVAHRLCDDRWRRKPGGERAKTAPVVDELDPGEADPSPSPYESAVWSLHLSGLLERIAKMPKVSRDALILCARGETYREIGAACNISPSRAYQLVLEARAALPVWV